MAGRQEELPALHAALAKGDYEWARVFGHQLKGTGSPYGFSDLTRLGAALENAAADRDSPELESLVDELEEYLSRVEIGAG